MGARVDRNQSHEIRVFWWPRYCKGADLDKDVSYQWLRFFLEDDAEVERIGKEYGSGTGEYWNTGSVKKRLIVELQRMVKEHQERRARITDDEVREWMQVRKLEF